MADDEDEVVSQSTVGLGDRKNQLYDETIQQNLKYSYYLAIVIWLTIVFYFSLLEADLFIVLILFIPAGVYTLSLWNLNVITIETEEKLFALSYLTTGVIILIPLLTWCHDRFEHEQKVMDAMVLSVILAVMSLIDIWVPVKYISYIKHVRSMFQIASLTLIIYILYYIFLKRKLKRKPVQVYHDDEHFQHWPEH